MTRPTWGEENAQLTPADQMANLLRRTYERGDLGEKWPLERVEAMIKHLAAKERRRGWRHARREERDDDCY